MARSPRTAGGFTLLELILSLTILGILVALIAPPIGRSERRWAAYAAARTLATDVARARATAIRERTTVRVVLDSSAQNLVNSSFSSTQVLSFECGTEQT